MMASKVGTVSVSGANLYYTVRGSGPVLLILQGGDGDADGMDRLTDQLVGDYTVVTYDRRGLSRSTLDDATGGAHLNLDTHGDDAHRLLAALTAEPAFVFGGSFGALLGLELVARHPEQVRTLVAHEPPVAALLPEAERARAEQGHVDIHRTYRQEGVAAAARKMAAGMAAMNFEDREPGLELPQLSSQQVATRAANREFFFAHDVPAVHSYRLDIAALTTVGMRIVPAAGRTSQETWTHHCAIALADRLNTEYVLFPGGHNGYILHPKAFAARLHQVLGEQ
jgi:pimeloyl-ACP methyl ester carboxylesterase